jgi:hypothetical protein
VLVYYQDQPTVYARIEAISPDVKKDWYQVTLQILTIPSQVVRWILREGYVDGEPFTMGGRPMRLEAVKPIPQGIEVSTPPDNKAPSPQGKVIPFKKP